APELARIEVLSVAEGTAVGTLPADVRRPLERILADVDDGGHVRGDLLAGPAPRLLVKLELEIVHAYGAQMRAFEIEKLVAFGWSFPFQHIHLVVAIEVILVGAVAELGAFQQLPGDVRVAGGGA